MQRVENERESQEFNISLDALFIKSFFVTQFLILKKKRKEINNFQLILFNQNRLNQTY